MYTHLFFDLDDTLLDFKKTERFAFIKLMSENDLEFSEEVFERYNQINRKVWQDLEKHLITSEQVKIRRFELFCEEMGIQANPANLSNQYLINLGQGTDFMEGAKTILEKIKGKFNLVLITNGLSVVQTPRIKNSGLGDLFSACVISEEVGVSKPSPVFFEIAWQRSGKPDKASILVIGDSLSSDIQGGINFCVDTCWYNPNGLECTLPATYQISTYTELAKILGV